MFIYFLFLCLLESPMLNIENQASLLITIHVKSLFVSLLPVVMIRAYTFTYVPITYTRDAYTKYIRPCLYFSTW